MVRDPAPPPGMGGSPHNTILIRLPYMEVSFYLIKRSMAVGRHHETIVDLSIPLGNDAKRFRTRGFQG